MAEFFAENGGTVLVLSIVAAVAAGVLVYLLRQRKAGKSGCGCGCANCPSKGICHPDK